MKKEMYLISACLAGINCKYNGKNNIKENILEIVKSGRGILICPEQLGGLSTPRDPSEITASGIITSKGVDVTKQYTLGALESLNIAKMYNIKCAILKSKSPSCGYGMIYDGTFTGKLISGMGKTTELFMSSGIEVISSDDEDKINAILDDIKRHDI